MLNVIESLDSVCAVM